MVDSELRGRDRERAVLEQLVEAARSGDSDALVLHGEPGIGKSALLDMLAGRLHGFHVTRAVGIESEMELAYAGLH